MRIRSIIFGFCWFLSLGTLLAQAPKIDDIYLRYQSGWNFRRLAHYFGAHQPKFRYALYRTDDSCPNGPYFILLLNHSLGDFPEGTSVRLEYYLARQPELQVVEFPLADLSGECVHSKEIWIGLTDTQHRGLSTKDILAWRFQWKDKNGQSIYDYKSFLFQERLPVIPSLSDESEKNPPSEIASKDSSNQEIKASVP